MTKNELFKQDESELILRLNNAKDLTGHQHIFIKFMAYFGKFSLSPELAAFCHNTLIGNPVLGLVISG
jgi:hypothetical protein